MAAVPRETHAAPAFPPEMPMTYGEHDPAHAYADRQECTYTQADLDRLLEITRAERDRARASLERAVHLLTGIRGLLYPAPITTAEGKTFVFRPDNPHEFMQALSDRIRAIPDELEKL